MWTAVRVMRFPRIWLVEALGNGGEMEKWLKSGENPEWRSEMGETWSKSGGGKARVKTTLQNRYTSQCSKVYCHLDTVCAREA